MPARYFRHLFLFSLFLIQPCGTAFAGNDASLAHAQDQARQQQLWQHPEWINLLHYYPHGSGFESHVDDSDFFNAPDGKINPQSEMLATLAAFYNDAADDDAHPQCRFPARFEWLNRHLDQQLNALPVARCALYKEWRANVPDEQLTLVFPAYHLNSPSSMFGHTLLRLDPAHVESGSEWLSIAVNFGANVSQDDNSLFYAFKGLAGGYPGFFIVTPYFKKIREYNRDENRDIWEYPLNLRPDEIKFMVTHLWELKEIEFDYYFFDENCSYRLLELLEVARPGIELTDEFDLTAIPVDTVRAVERAGLIKTADYRPSQVTVLNSVLQQIPEQHHAQVARLAQNPDEMNSAEFQALEPAIQRNMISAAYKYLRYEQGTTPREESASRISYRLLEKLNSYPASIAADIEPEATRPESGHYSRRASLTLGKREQGNFAEVGYRMSFHSLEDNENGFLQGAQINLGNLQLRVYEDESLKVQQLDLVDIFSLTPRSDFIKPLSWRIYTGLERQPTNRTDVLTSHVTGGAGVAYALAKNNVSYVMAGLRLEHNREFEDSIEPALGLLAGTVQHFGKSTAHLQLHMDEFDNNQTRRVASYTQNFVLSTNHSIRVQAQRQNHEDVYNSEVSLAYQYYF